MKERGGFLIVFVTARDAGEAESIARAVVDEKLAACVNVLAGCRSVYRWQGRTVKEDEALMVVKTSRGLVGDLERRIRELHSYDVPEFVALEPALISEDYRAFLKTALGG